MSHLHQTSLDCHEDEAFTMAIHQQLEEIRGAPPELQRVRTTEKSVV